MDCHSWYTGIVAFTALNWPKFILRPGPCYIYGAQSGTRTGSLSTSVFLSLSFQQYFTLIILAIETLLNKSLVLCLCLYVCHASVPHPPHPTPQSPSVCDGWGHLKQYPCVTVFVFWLQRHCLIFFFHVY
jgi:hypothetical protein